MTTPLRSGFCNPSNPPDSHGRCNGDMHGRRCACPCHEVPAGPVLVPVDVGSPEWHEARRQGVTASEIPVILGLAPWGSAFNLHWQKRGVTADDRDNDAMAWGRDLEDVILRRFAREHPELVVSKGGLFRHGADPRWMATPDGLAGDGGDRSGCPGHLWNLGEVDIEPVAVVQAKTAGSQEHWGEPGTDQIPVYYLAQVRWEMHVMGVGVAFVPVLFSGRTYREYVVEQDPDDVALMVDAAGEFLADVAAGNPPEVDWRPATTATLKAIHPDVDDAEVEVPATWVRQWQLADRLEKAAAQRKRLAENRIRHRMGRAQRATVNGHRVASRSVYEMRERVLPPTTVHRIYVTKKEIPQ